MAKGLFMAWSSPVDPSREAEFNTWYDETHVPQLRAAIPSITSVSRYATVETPADQGNPPPHRFLTVYELDTTDIPAVQAALGEAASTGKLDMTDTIATDPPAMLRWYVGL